MVLVDTSVWILHLRQGSGQLRSMLLSDMVLTHPFVVGELACGNLAQRAVVLDSLASLPSAALASQDEAMRLLAERGLSGKGIGWVDVHLLAAAKLSRAWLWTLDTALSEAAGALGVAWAAGPGP
jgi:hypothetical protein